ncbi:MAG: hypothetical protein ACPHID_00025 [Thermoplasmatota archaeon]
MAWIAEGLHRTEQGHLVPAKASVPSLKSGDDAAILNVGHGAVVQGFIEHAGGVILARGVTVWQDVQGGHEVIVGPDCHVRGPVRAVGRVVIEHGARIDGDVEAGGDVLLLGQAHVQDVKAGGDIVIVGSPQTGRLDPGGRIQTRPW